MKYTDNKNSKPDTRQQILTYIQNSDMTSPADINTQFDINRQMIHRHLKKLVEMGFIKKIGSAPKVFYTAITDDTTISDYQINTDTKSIVDKNFFFIEPAGTELSGINGFEKWCNKRNFDISKKAEEFKKVIEKYQKKKDNDLLDASKKMKNFWQKLLCRQTLLF